MTEATVTLSDRMKLSIQAYDRLRDPRFTSPGAVEGMLERTAENCSFVQLLDAHSLVFPNSAFDSPQPGDWATVELQPPTEKDCYFAQNFGQVLALNDSILVPPRDFFVAELGYLHSRDRATPPTLIKRYLEAARLADLLVTSSDHHDNAKGYHRVVFLHKAKLEIPLVVESNHFRDLPGIDSLIKKIADPAHSDQRKTIFKSVLLDKLGSVRIDDRFRNLIANFDQVVTSFDEHYQTYVSEFSFDKVMKEVNSKKLDYMIKLNKTFADIQNQVLALPVAVLVVGAQMKEEKGVTFANVGIVLGILVFGMLLFLLVQNQRHSLQALMTEITLENDAFVRKEPALGEKFKSAYTDLKDRYKRQKWMLIGIQILVGVTMIGTCGVFAWRSGWIFASATVPAATSGLLSQLSALV